VVKISFICGSSLSVSNLGHAIDDFFASAAFCLLKYVSSKARCFEPVHILSRRRLLAKRWAQSDGCGVHSQARVCAHLLSCTGFHRRLTLHTTAKTRSYSTFASAALFVEYYVNICIRKKSNARLSWGRWLAMLVGPRSNTSR
jgi:hypothetical protein